MNGDADGAPALAECFGWLGLSHVHLPHEFGLIAVVFHPTSVTPVQSGSLAAHSRRAATTAGSACELD
jgi:hypothetical protein